MRYVLILIMAILSSCSTEDKYIRQIITEYPRGDIYMLDRNKFIIFNNDSLKLYYIEYFKGSTFIINAVKIK